MINYIIKFLDRLKLNARFNLFIAALLIIVFSSLGFYLYQTQKQEIFNKADKQLIVLLEDLINIFEVQTNMKLENITSSIKFSKSLYNDKGGIKESNELLETTITNQKNKKITTVQVNKWFLEDQELHESNEFVDFIKSNGVETTTILQKTTEGYVRISTNVLYEDGERAVNTFIPNTSPVVQAIDKGEAFIGRAWVVNGWYLTSYEPIYIKGEIKGILAVGVKQMDYDILQPIFYRKKYFQSGYPYVVSGDGFSVINVSGIEGRNLNGTKFFASLVRSKDNNQEKFRYKWPENAQGQWKWTYLKYFKPLDLYIATSVFEYELYSGLTQIRDGIIVGVIISIIIFFVGISFIIRPITRSIQSLVQIISTMSRGEVVNRIYYRRKDEIGDIINSLNVLIKGLNETARFSNEIEKGNFDSDFIPLSKKDMLGNSLLDMRESLKKAKEEEEKRKQEDQKRSWANEGLAKFGYILRQNNDSLQSLADNVIKNLVRYLSANQGGLFIYNTEEENEEEAYFELISAFAYNRKKYYKKKIMYNDGIIGSCAVEKNTVYMTDIPDDYIEIESGLGTANPRCILIVPLKLEDKIFGAIEIASFIPFEKHEVGFVEKLAENIASSFAAAQINAQTVVLLRKSQEQGEAMAAQEKEMRSNLEELKKIQEESDRRQREMSGVVSALNISFLVSELDMNGKIVVMNNAFLKIYRLSEDQVVGKHHTELMVEEDMIIDFQEIWDEIKRGKGKKRVQYIINAAAEEYWISETYTPILDGNGVPYKVLNIAVDITESKKQELEIQQLLKDSRKKAKKLIAQERLNHYNLEKLEKAQFESAKNQAEMSSILDAIDNTLIRGEYELDSTIIFVNERFIKKLEYAEEQIIGKNNRKFIPSEDLETFEAIWKNVIEGNAYDGVERRKTRTGKEVWLLMSYTPVKDKNGNITKVLLLANDITKRKMSENKARTQAKKLLEKNKKNRENIKKLHAVEKELDINQKELKILYEHITNNMFFIEMNIDGTITQVSEFAEKKLKISADKLIGKNHKETSEISSKDQEEAYERFWQDLKEAKPINQINCSIENGKAIWISESYIPVYDNNGTVVKVLKIVRDISQDFEEEDKQKIKIKADKNNYTT